MISLQTGTITTAMSGVSLVADVAGNVTAAWADDFGAAASELGATATAWDALVDISTPPSGVRLFSARTFQAAVNGSGDVSGVWVQRNDDPIDASQHFFVELNSFK